MAREVVGSVWEVGMGSCAWTEFEVCTRREAMGRLSRGECEGERTYRGCRVQVGVLQHGRLDGEVNRHVFEMARGRTWCSQSSERHIQMLGVGWLHCG